MPSSRYLDSLLQKAKEYKPSQPDKSKRVLIDSYGDVKIYKDPAEAMLSYEIPSPHYKGEEKALIDALIEIALGVITFDAAGMTIEEKKEHYKTKVVEIIDRTPELKVPNTMKEFYATAVAREMAGYGLLDPLTTDDQLEEIMVIGPNKPVYVYHRKHEVLKTNVVFYDDKDIRDLVDRVARAIGRRIDLQVPLLDARLRDGSRVNATLMPISLDGATLTLRKFKKDPLTVIDLVNFNTIDYRIASFLWLAADGAGAFPANILISGGTASGKTTSLNMLNSFIPSTERVISIEDIAELNLPLPHWIRMEVRPPGIEGTGEITMNDLVKNSVRMRPDRIIVGEIRAAEGYTLFAAMNTGHRGALTGGALIQMSDGNIKTIESIASAAFSKRRVKQLEEFEYVEIGELLKVVSWNKKTLEFESKRISRVWRKKTKQKLVKITLEGEKEITLTPDHPLYVLRTGTVLETSSESVKTGDLLACPSKIVEKIPQAIVSGNGFSLMIHATDANLQCKPVSWKAVSSVEEVDFDGFVYDFTVNDNHTYVANGIVVSNCFGTVHANSAKETLVRLTSPPINVPEVMISSLNLILMQNRIHDRRKGTLRRITEIAEVNSAAGDTPSLQTLFEWDPVTDTFKETGNESYYLQLLSKYTGFTQADIERELKLRESLLRELARNNKRGINEVCEVTQSFVPKRKLMI